MEVLVKSSGPPKVDPKHPESHPGYKAAVAKGKQRLAKMKFENEAQKRDYMKQVASNPNNVPGLPTFYPAATLGQFSGFGGIDVVKKDILPCGKKWAHARYDQNGVATYKCSGCDCDKQYKEEDLTTQ